MPGLLLVLCMMQTAPAAQTPVARAESLLDLLVKREFTKAVAMFDEEMTKALPEPKLREIWTSAESQLGALQKREAPSVEQRGPHHVVTVRAVFTNARVDITIAVDASGRIAGLFLRPVEAPRQRAA